MKWIAKIVLLASLVLNSVYAQVGVLRVGIAYHYPPFAVQASNKVFFGFDVSMMSYICKQLNRKCQFKTYSFDKLFPALKNQEVDAIASGLTITLEREKEFDFSKPYLRSYASFLGRADFARAFSGLTLLNNKTLGVVRGTIFKSTLESLGFKNIKIVTFKRMNKLIEALRDKRVDAVLIDRESAVFWEHHSAHQLEPLSAPFEVGLGFGIAINQENEVFLNQINDALASYLNSKQFKRAFRKYQRYPLVSKRYHNKSKN
jgi:polar amino acid transport system substrate-binding protein